MSVVYLVRHGQASFGSADYDVLSELGYRQAALVGAELRARGVRVDLAVSGTLRRQRETARTALDTLARTLQSGEAEAAPAGLTPAEAVGGAHANGTAFATAAGAVGVGAAGGGGWADEVERDSRWNEYDQDWIINRHADVGGAPLAATRMSASRGGLSSRAFQGLLDVALSDWISRTDDTGPGSFVAFSDAVGDALDGLVRRLGPGGTAVVFSSAGPIAAVCGRLLGMSADGLVSLNRVMINGGITKVVSGRSGTSLISINEHSHIDAAGRDLLSYR